MKEEDSSLYSRGSNKGRMGLGGMCGVGYVRENLSEDIFQ